MIGSWLPDLAQLLGRLVRENAEPDVVRQAVREFAASTGVAMTVLCQRESYDDSWNYDVVADLKGETLSLSVGKKPDLPWPLRGAQRWEDGYIVRVNGEPVRVVDAFAALEFPAPGASATQAILDAELIRQLLDKSGEAILGSGQEGVDGHAEAGRGLRPSPLRQARLLCLAGGDARAFWRAGLRHQEEKSVEDECAAHLTEGLVVFAEFTDAGSALEFVRPRPEPAWEYLRRLFLSQPAAEAWPVIRTERCSRPDLAGIFRCPTDQIGVRSLLGPVAAGRSHLVAEVIELFEPALPLEPAELNQGCFRLALQRMRREAMVDWLWGEGLRQSPDGNATGVGR
jgi:hypothetical protein